MSKTKIKRLVSHFLKLKNTIKVILVLKIIFWLKDHIENITPTQNKTKTIQISTKPLLVTYSHRRDYFIPSSLKKKDWHNYSLIEHEEKRVGFGEHGEPAFLPDVGQKENQIYMVNGFNAAISDKIPLNRSLPDARHPACKKKLYLEFLPTVSVIVPFYDEHWSTLLRTAFSVQYRSPDHLIKEIVMVDDGSKKDILKDELDNYVKKNMPKVKIVRLAKRSGLIAARLAGAKAVTAGDVLIFLDSHVEANVNWLPPLLEPIALNYRVVVCPVIDFIDFETFQYKVGDNGGRGAFDWDLIYKRLPLLPRDVKNMPEPFESPVMMGGLFAISRTFFWELGGYDPGLLIWGGEQFELSFKIWQCGGRMIDAPCSRVGHMYRRYTPFPNQTSEFGEYLAKNNRRVAQVWMDEYEDYMYVKRPWWRNIDPGDLKEQKELRKKLKCKPFRWFMTQVAFDLPQNYPMIEPKSYAGGWISPALNPNVCVDGHRGLPTHRFTLTPCNGDDEQIFDLTWHKDVWLKARNICWDSPNSARGSPVLLEICHNQGGNQKWRYHEVNKTFVHSSGACLDHNPETLELYVNSCIKKAPTQQWIIETINREEMARWVDVEPVTGPIEEWKD